MNNENNGLNNMGQPVPPTEVPGAAQPVTPLTQETVQPTPEAVPVEAPATPEVAPVASETPAEPVTPVTPEAPTGETTTAPTEEKKDNKLAIILIVFAVVLAIGACLWFFVFNKNESGDNGGGNNNNNNNGGGNTTPTTNSGAEEFLALAKEYAAAVDTLWKEDKMQCIDAHDPSKLLKPSELSSTDAEEGVANYFVFIDSDNSEEMNLNISNPKKVYGFVRIDKASGSHYIGLSDGTNYILDKGNSINKPTTTELTVSDVHTDGNGSFLQYRNGTIYGSSTEGDGWGIADYSLLSDDDESNDGIYSSFGPKTYTSYCSNITE